MKIRKEQHWYGAVIFLMFRLLSCPADYRLGVTATIQDSGISPHIETPDCQLSKRPTGATPLLYVTGAPVHVQCTAVYTIHLRPRWRAPATVQRRQAHTLDAEVPICPTTAAMLQTAFIGHPLVHLHTEAPTETTVVLGRSTLPP